MSSPNANETLDPKTPTQTTAMWPVTEDVSPSAAAPAAAARNGPAVATPVTNPTKSPKKNTPKTPAKGPAKSPAKKTDPAPTAGNIAQSSVEKQTPAVASGARRPAPAGNNGPPAKKQKVAASKPNQPPPAAKKSVTPNNRGSTNKGAVNSPINKASANKGPSNTNTAAPVAAPAPVRRPRGRPPGPAAAAKLQAARAVSLNPSFKAEQSPGPDGGRRGKKASNQAPVPWTVAPTEPRKVLSDDISLLENGMFADATIVCLKHTWRVHKTVLCTRSKWFLKALEGDQEGGQTGIVNLHSDSKEDVETLLTFIYSGFKLGREISSIENGSFVLYARIFNLGETFELKPLADDALSLLGQYCDKRLVELCSYDVEKSGREGVVDEIRGSPQPFIDDLLKAIKDAYDGSEQSNRLQAVLVSFVWAGRDRLFREKELVAFADLCPRFGTDMFKLMLGHNPGKWFPSAKVGRTMCAELDHTRKTQHPDRCESCDDVFDEEKVRKALYNPFNVAVRAGAWCATCVNKTTGVPLWRRMPTEREAKE